MARRVAERRLRPNGARLTRALFCLFTFLSLATTAGPAFSECVTHVPAGTISGQTWTPEGSPYCIDGDIVINSLTIQPAVEVWFTGSFSMAVEGILTAIGTSDAKIAFAPAPDNAGGWKGIEFIDSLPGSELAHFTLEGSTQTGIEVKNSSPTIRDCAIRKNSCHGSHAGSALPLCGRVAEGGGVYTDTSLTITRCEVSENTVTDFGGVGHTVRAFGAGIFVDEADLTLIDCIVARNVAHTSAGGTFGNAFVGGGGIHVQGGELSLTRTVVDSNSAVQTCNFGCPGFSPEHNLARGGGILLTPSATADANALCSATVTNSLVTRNDAVTPGARGGGIGIDKCPWPTPTCANPPGGPAALCAVEIVHSTLSDNAPDAVANSTGAVTALSSILWQNLPGHIVGDADVTCSDVGPLQSPFPGTSNINLNPVFLVPDPDDVGYDVHIDATVSPVIDQCDGEAPPLPADDFDGDPRPLGVRFDMGADEVGGAPCGDGDVDLEEGEECDDGNRRSGDCCNSSCRFEPPGSSCADAEFCDGAETCNGTGSCQPGTDPCFPQSCDEDADTCTNECGDGSVGVAEECDDGNLENGDCCSATCEFEASGSSCADAEFCDGAETCNGAGSCQPGGNPCPGQSCNEATDMCEAVPVCGDGVVGGAETCDDGNTTPGDCCSEACQYEASGSSCADGDFCDGAETCDGAGGCQPSSNPCTSGSCDEETDTCVVCGDGFVGATETCDDGNTTSGDCCSSTCQYEAAGNSCSDGLFCNGAEQCDGAGICQPGTAPCEDCVEDEDSCPATFDALIPTRSLSMKDDQKPPIDASKKKWSFSSSTKKEPNVLNRIVPPARGGPDDPTVVGGSLRVIRADGGEVCGPIALSAGGWTAQGSASKPKGFRYRSTSGPITDLSIAPDSIKLKGGGAGWCYTLDESMQGAVRIELSLGGQDWCAVAPGNSKDEPGSFKSKNAPAPADCPEL